MLAYLTCFENVLSKRSNKLYFADNNDNIYILSIYVNKYRPPVNQSGGIIYVMALGLRTRRNKNKLFAVKVGSYLKNLFPRLQIRPQLDFRSRAASETSEKYFSGPTSQPVNNIYFLT